ncbi:hypothetical protein K5X82_02430 [Halosquirtibacter xylanolyticus]|uniref:hypothetical protein n=1 Tax=Halosquirtibacter xylanolyticus TaxID=3374599 RepID=UPI00374A79BD|nr:hypothetical protein K5X82_02430 [Prolixibacteraceae bacterium]
MFKIESLSPNNPQHIKEFIQLAYKIYEDKPLWGNPLDLDVENRVTPSQNPMLRKGDFALWLVRDNNNQAVGRIAGLALHDDEIGQLGFFECIEDQEVSTLLFDTASAWMISKGKRALDGPVNFGMRDEFWGCLIEGEYTPVYNMPYNPSYYATYFEAYGFKNYFNQITYFRKMEAGVLHPLVTRAGQRVLRNSDFTVRNIGKDNPNLPSYFMEIYNNAWAAFEGVPPISLEEATKQMKMIEPIIDKRLIVFGFHKERPISFFIMMPDVGQIFKTFKGKFGWWEKLKFFFLLKREKTIDRVIGRIFGVVPEFQGKGMEAAMVVHFEKVIAEPNFPYKTLELNWIGDFNPPMMKVSKMIGGTEHKKHTTYRLPLAEDFIFERAKVVNL